VDGEIDLGVDEVARVWNQASEFVCKTFDDTIKSPRRWKEYVYLFFKFKTLTNFYRHVEFIDACIGNRKVHRSPLFLFRSENKNGELYVRCSA
jgi:hypothetical protein